ncbi:amino acid ABC transporter substrate-binding protein [Antrihabitans stalagmiti]|uniref:amino acid ABC transporter substrate-binding protein n=1 Tax=Antrihabitans stalagmiti TaxID=2799499 RepID=UPI0027DC3655|nr:amino acid ABC transporter substrate-binding protein [Antrihabitans stalagmiti]
MRRKMIAIAFAAIAAVSFTGCGGDSDGPVIDKVKEDGVLKVGTEGTYPPFSFQENGELAGYDIEVIEAVGEKLGVRVEFVQIPWDSIFAGLESKRFDLVANQVTLNDDRKGKYDLSEPYTVSEGVIVTRADNNDITTLADLQGKTTAQSATSNWAKVATDAGAKVESVEGFVQAIQLLKDGRVDATVNDNLAVADYQKQKNDSDIKIAGTTDDTSLQVFAARKDSGLIADVNKALDELRADGTLAKISDKYFGQDVSQQ